MNKKQTFIRISFHHRWQTRATGGVCTLVATTQLGARTFDSLYLKYRPPYPRKMPLHSLPLHQIHLCHCAGAVDALPGGIRPLAIPSENCCLTLDGAHVSNPISTVVWICHEAKCEPSCVPRSAGIRQKGVKVHS